MNKSNLNKIGELNIPLDEKNGGLITLPIDKEPKKQKILGLIKELWTKIKKILLEKTK